MPRGRQLSRVVFASLALQFVCCFAISSICFSQSTPLKSNSPTQSQIGAANINAPATQPAQTADSTSPFDELSEARKLLVSANAALQQARDAVILRLLQTSDEYRNANAAVAAAQARVNAAGTDASIDRVQAALDKLNATQRSNQILADACAADDAFMSAQLEVRSDAASYNSLLAASNAAIAQLRQEAAEQAQFEAQQKAFGASLAKTTQPSQQQSPSSDIVFVDGPPGNWLTPQPVQAGVGAPMGRMIQVVSTLPPLAPVALNPIRSTIYRGPPLPGAGGGDGLKPSPPPPATTPPVLGTPVYLPPIVPDFIDPNSSSFNSNVRATPDTQPALQPAFQPGLQPELEPVTRPALHSASSDEIAELQSQLLQATGQLEIERAGIIRHLALTSEDYKKAETEVADADASLRQADTDPAADRITAAADKLRAASRRDQLVADAFAADETCQAIQAQVDSARLLYAKALAAQNPRPQFAVRPMPATQP